MDLVTFLRARLDEREQRVAAILRRAPHWRVDLGDSEPWKTNGVGIVDDHDDAVALAVGSYAAEFIALNDPQFVLADVAAKRRLLDLHEPIPSCSAGILQCRHCADLCHSGSGLSCDSPDAPYPCPTVRLLAASFAQHPDFDPAWAA